MEILSCMQFVLHAGQVGVFFLNNFALAEQLQNSEGLKFCEKEEKKKTKEGEKVAPRRQGSVCPQPNFFFGSRVFGF